MQNIEKIVKLKTLAKELELENCAVLDRYNDEVLARIYNGIGPDAMPDYLRGAISLLHAVLEPATLIHDVEFYEGGDKQSFSASNRRLHANGVRLAKNEYAWYNPIRYIMCSKAWRFAVYCEIFGRQAWKKLPEKIEEKES